MSVACSVENCTSPSWSRGWCQRHYARWRRTGSPQAHLGRYERVHPAAPKVRKERIQGLTECIIDGCGGDVAARGWCGKHYKRWEVHGDPLADFTRRAKQSPCEIEGCSRVALCRGWCSLHYSRWRNHGDAQWEPAPVPPRRIGKSGYAVVRAPSHPNAWGNGDVAEHVLVMSEKLGRPIRPGETVHHINGVRHDNRPENLELWTSRHCKGQRVTELLAWAHELIEAYKDTPQAWPDHLRS